MSQGMLEASKLEDREIASPKAPRKKYIQSLPTL